MKILELDQMETLNGGSNRICFIDGFLTGAAIAVGTTAAGPLGGLAALIAGLYAANDHGCL